MLSIFRSPYKPHLPLSAFFFQNFGSPLFFPLIITQRQKKKKKEKQVSAACWQQRSRVARYSFSVPRLFLPNLFVASSPLVSDWFCFFCFFLFHSKLPPLASASAKLCSSVNCYPPPLPPPPTINLSGSAFTLESFTKVQAVVTFFLHRMTRMHVASLRRLRLPRDLHRHTSPGSFHVLIVNDRTVYQAARRPSTAARYQRPNELLSADSAASGALRRVKIVQIRWLEARSAKKTWQSSITKTRQHSRCRDSEARPSKNRQ